MAKILLLTPQLPYPTHQGTSLRNFNIIQGLAQIHQVTLLSFLEDNQTTEPAVIQPLLDLCQQIVTVPVPSRSTGKRLGQLLTTRLPDMAHRLYSTPFDISLRRLLTENEFDIVQIEGIELARYAESIRIVSNGIKIIFDDHNAETELQQRNFETDLRQPKRWVAAGYSWVQVQRLARFERWACDVADGVTAVSSADKIHLQKLLPDKPITVIPNCIDVSQYQLDMAETIPFDLVFSGKMDYRPNVDAVLWFADAVWPLVRKQRPLATLAIVGQKPHARLERLREVDGITLTGWVDKVQPYLAGAKVYIMPFRIGSGTRLKLIEAMAAGLPIVSTPIGAEGFPVQSGREIVLAERPEEMATAVVTLLNNPEQRQQLGASARQFAQQYDWRQVIPRFEQVYQAL